MAKMNYQKSGVNIKQANAFSKAALVMSQKTHHQNVIQSQGGFASLYRLDAQSLIASSTDGVGTKLKLAFEYDHHHTVGIDLVAMVVNDLLCVGALPLFFLDYFATGKLKPKVAHKVLKGITEGCRQAECSLVGGETAEMPGFYSANEYDLAGFSVGMVQKKVLLPQKLTPGDVLIGLASTGCHSNGYSLLRKLLEKEKSQKRTIAKQLLKPTQVYVNALKGLIQKRSIKGVCHITGSGYLNVSRMSQSVSYRIELPSQNEVPEVYRWIRRVSGLSSKELCQTFNMGLGMVLAVDQAKVKSVMKHLNHKKQKAWIVGEVLAKKKQKTKLFLKDSNGEEVILSGSKI